MRFHRLAGAVRWDVLLSSVALAAALAWVFALAYWPHLAAGDDLAEAEGAGAVLREYAAWLAGEREGYSYPLHYDEHVHWGRSAQLVRERGFTEDFDPLLVSGLHERGFALLVAQVHLATGLDLRTIVEWLPSVWSAVTALAVYAMLRPRPAALAAAAAVALVPTNPRFLGPSLLVPIGFVLAWLPATAMLAEMAPRRPAAAVLLAAVVGWSFHLHLIGGFACLLLALAVLAATWRASQPATDLVVALAAAVVPLLWLPEGFVGDFRARLAARADRAELLPFQPEFYDLFGRPAMVLFAVGAAWFLLRRGADRLLVAWTVATAAMLALVAASLAFAPEQYATYDRWHHPMFLGMAVVATGFLGDAATRPRGRAARAAAAAGAVLAVGVVLGAPVAEIAGTQYYHVLNDVAWRDIEVAAALPPEYEVLYTQPGLAPVVEAVTGREVWHAPNSRGLLPPADLTAADLVRADVSAVLVARVPTDPYYESVPGSGVRRLPFEAAAEVARLRASERP